MGHKTKYGQRSYLKTLPKIEQVRLNDEQGPVSKAQIVSLDEESDVFNLKSYLCSNIFSCRVVPLCRLFYPVSLSQALFLVDEFVL